MDDELGAEAERFALQDQVDEVNRFTCLLLRCAMRDLIRVELDFHTMDGDDFHLMQGLFSTRSSSA